MRKSSDLKPCPFCGKTVRIVKCGDKHSRYWMVTRAMGSASCECRMFMESSAFSFFATKEEQDKAKQDLVAAWNRRANDV